jgi:hypothetical protein
MLPISRCKMGYFTVNLIAERRRGTFEMLQIGGVQLREFLVGIAIASYAMQV